MKKCCDIGIIGAMDGEVAAIISRLEGAEVAEISGIKFYTGDLYGKRVTVAKCGIGKVFAAICTEAMILNFSPKLIVNTGVGGALDKSLRPLDIVFATSLVQHDMDTSALGDPRGMVSGINRVYFDTDTHAIEVLSECASVLGVNFITGTVASGDKFIAEAADKARISSEFGAVACEMEGAAVAHVAFVNGTPCAVVRAISDSADGDAGMDYMTFLPKATEISTSLTLGLVEKY